MLGWTHTQTHARAHTHTQIPWDKQPPSLSQTWPTSQISAPFILQYIELLCASPRQRPAILLKAGVNHLWQRGEAKDEDLHIHTSLLRTVGRVEFLCLTRQWWINFFFPLLLLSSGICDARNKHIFSSGNTCSVAAFPVSLSLCGLYKGHVHACARARTHTGILFLGYSTSSCLKEFISSYQS